MFFTRFTLVKEEPFRHLQEASGTFMLILFIPHPQTKDDINDEDDGDNLCVGK